MTSTRGWHAETEALQRWVAGAAGPLTSASVEQHVARCVDCQAKVGALVSAESLRAGWENVLAEVELPRPGSVERLLCRLGVAPSDALVMASAVTLRLAWLAGLVGVLGFTLLAAALGPEGGVALFLIAAPLIPVAGVAAAYGPSADPSYEATLAAPYAMIRLVLLRVAAVLATSAPLTVAAGLLLPVSTLTAVAWLLPAAGFTAAVLTASNWIDPEPAAVVVGIAWAGAVAFAARSGDPLDVFAVPALVGYAVLLVAAGGVLGHRLLAAEPSWRLR